MDNGRARLAAALEQCPTCQKVFPVTEILGHANQCLDEQVRELESQFEFVDADDTTSSSPSSLSEKDPSKPQSLTTSDPIAVSSSAYSSAPLPTVSSSVPSKTSALRRFFHYPKSPSPTPPSPSSSSSSSSSSSASPPHLVHSHTMGEICLHRETPEGTYTSAKELTTPTSVTTDNSSSSAEPKKYDFTDEKEAPISLATTHDDEQEAKHFDPFHSESFRGFVSGVKRLFNFSSSSSSSSALSSSLPSQSVLAQMAQDSERIQKLILAETQNIIEAVDEEKYKRTKLVPLSVSVLEEWNKVEIPEEPIAASKQLQWMIRRGVPDNKRREVWCAVTGLKQMIEQRGPNWFYIKRACALGEVLPTKHYNVPLFGGELHPESHCLSAQGYLSLQRILCILAFNYSAVAFAPMLPDLTFCLLHFLSEEETYVLLDHYVTEGASTLKHFAISFVAENQIVDCFLTLARKRLPVLLQHANHLGVDLGEAMRLWMRRFFVGTLPYFMVLRILDIYLNEDVRIFIRIALSILSESASLLVTTSSLSEFYETLNRFCHDLRDTSALFGDSLSINVPKSLVRENVTMPETRAYQVYYRPSIKIPSSIITNEQFELLYMMLPRRVKLLDPHRIFTTEEDGYSLQTLIDRGKRHKYTVLIIRTETKRVFGAYINTRWQWSDIKTWWGDNQFFLFIIHPTPQIFPVTLKNRFICFTDRSGIKFGMDGNGYGMTIDYDLERGSSTACDTFGNFPLSEGDDPDGKFRCTTLELFSFQ